MRGIAPRSNRIMLGLLKQQIRNYRPEASGMALVTMAETAIALGNTDTAKKDMEEALLLVIEKIFEYGAHNMLEDVIERVVSSVVFEDVIGAVIDRTIERLGIRNNKGLIRRIEKIRAESYMYARL